MAAARAKMIVGFIGLGTMGRNAARNVQRAGFRLVVNDLRPEAARELVEGGASWGRLLNDAADSPITEEGSADQYRVRLGITRSISLDF